MIKLTVSDLDGTLLPHGDNEVSQAVRDRIDTLLGAGMTFAISSGRTYGELLGFLPEYIERIYYICCDGACCIKDGKLLYARKIENEDLELFFKVKNPDFSFVLHGAFENYAFGDVPKEAERFGAVKISSKNEIREKIFKVTSYGERVKLPTYCGMRTHWDGGENLSAQYVNRYSDKGVALSDLQMRLMLSKFDTACIGDSGNDLAMMKSAKLTYCVGERCEELAAVCTYKADRGEEALDDILRYIKG